MENSGQGINIWVAASDGKMDLVVEMITSGKYNVNAQDENGYTPLMAAVSYNHVELVKTLIVLGANVNLGDKEMDTPLHVCETQECALILLQHHANLQAKNENEQTPIEVKMEDEEEDMMNFYLQYMQQQ